MALTIPLLPPESRETSMPGMAADHAETCSPVSRPTDARERRGPIPALDGQAGRHERRTSVTKAFGLSCFSNSPNR